MYVQITTKCNFACAHCMFSCRPGAGTHMGMAVFEAAGRLCMDHELGLFIGGGVCILAGVAAHPERTGWDRHPIEPRGGAERLRSRAAHPLRGRFRLPHAQEKYLCAERGGDEYPAQVI